MIYSDRVRARMAAIGVNQSELARRVGVTQGAIAKIANKNPNGSSHLHVIARELLTTAAYLTGEIDDPDAGAPPAPPAPAFQLITMSVALPSEDALAEMFEGLIEAIGRQLPPAEFARELAQLLPTALSQARARPSGVQLASLPAPDATLATVDREPQQ